MISVEKAPSAVAARVAALRAKKQGADASNRVTFEDLWIRNTKKQIVRFEPNPLQSDYLDILAPKWREGAYDIARLREILLKARQIGFSTLIEALFFCDTINTPNTQTVVIAHDVDTSVELFQMVKTFYDHLPPEKKPETIRSNRRELRFAHNNSAFFVGTAGNLGFGRGRTINNVHGSEVALWGDAEELLTGLLQAVPKDGNVFLETTAKGLGNYYHEEYMLALNGGSAYSPRFFPWYGHPEYVSEVPTDFRLTPKEEQIKRQFNLSLEQLAWYREKRIELKDKLPQEHPCTAEEAFISSGNPYFDRERLKEILGALSSDPDLQPIEVDIPDHFKLLIKYREKISFYKAPKEGRSYLIGADTAEGLDESGKHDFDAADVLDWDTWEQVCHLHGSWDTHEYGLVLDEIGRFYNKALVAVERNNHGHAVLNALIYSAQYPNVYYDEQYDEYKKESVKKPGWPTTPKTKTLALDTLATGITEQGVHIRNRKTVGELMTFVKLPGGKAGGEGSSHDDRVMSLAIACAVALTQKPAQEWAIY